MLESEALHFLDNISPQLLIIQYIYSTLIMTMSQHYMNKLIIIIHLADLCILLTLNPTRKTRQQFLHQLTKNEL